MKENLGVTVLIPLYGESKYLRQAIESVKIQKFPSEWEIVIVYKNANSTIDAHVGDTKITFIHQKSSGLPAALNEGVHASKYPFVARLDCDDFMEPNRIERQMIEFQKRPNLVALGGQATIVDHSGLQIGSIKYPTGTKLMEWALKFSCPLAHPATTIKKTALIKAGGYRSGFTHAEDHDLWTRLIFEGAIDNLKENVLFYRRHQNQLSTINKMQIIRVSANLIAVSNSRKPREIFNCSDPSEIEKRFPESSELYINFLDYLSSRNYRKLLIIIVLNRKIRFLFYKKILLRLYYAVLRNKF